MGCRRFEWLSEYRRPSSRVFFLSPLSCEAQLRLGKRDRPSRLHPRTARSGEGDARVKAGGTMDNDFLGVDRIGRASRCTSRDLSANL
jgi:hypothetical protein